MDDELSEVIQLARKMELDGIEFYTDAARKSANPQAQRLFDSFAGDEKRHLEIVEKIAQGIGVNVEDMSMPRDEIRTVFGRADAEISPQQEASADELTAIEIALGMEKDSYDLYKGRADAETDAVRKALFERLAEEENQHYEILENTRQYLTDNNKWVLWNEWGLLTGDMSSLGG